MKLIFVLIPLAISFPGLVWAAPRKCYALAMEGICVLELFLGGMSHNAYSVGVLNAIWKNLPKEARSYDVVSGKLH